MNTDNFKSRLGRIHLPDERDKKYQIKSLLPAEMPGVDYKYWWPSGWWGDQGYYPHCVAYSWAHWLAAGPITQKKSRTGGKAPVDTTYLYTEAQKVDQWPGEDYDGTSVRAGATILKNLGFIKSYNWAWDIENTVNALLTLGPVVVGTVWTYGMCFPDEKGVIDTSGSILGGHAYLLDGVNVKKKMIRIKNSWGREWGKNGFAYISFDDMNGLIQQYGEICLAVEEEKLKYML
jgi:hypothetical protein